MARFSLQPNMQTFDTLQCEKFRFAPPYYLELFLAKGQGVLNKCLYESNLYIPFLRKKYPFSIPSVDEWYPFHIPCLERCIPFNCCKCTVFLMGITKIERFLDFIKP